MSSTGESKLVIFAGGIVIGGAVAIGTAYLMSRQFTYPEDPRDPSKDFKESPEERARRRQSVKFERRRQQQRSREVPQQHTSRSGSFSVEPREHSTTVSQSAPPSRSTTPAPYANPPSQQPVQPLQSLQPLRLQQAAGGTPHSPRAGVHVPCNNIFQRAGVDAVPSPQDGFPIGSPSGSLALYEQSLAIQTAATPIKPIRVGTGSPVLDNPMSPSFRRMQMEESDDDKMDLGLTEAMTSDGESSRIDGRRGSLGSVTGSMIEGIGNREDPGGRGSRAAPRKPQPVIPMISPSDRGSSAVAMSVLSNQLSPRVKLGGQTSQMAPQPSSNGNGVPAFRQALPTAAPSAAISQSQPLQQQPQPQQQYWGAGISSAHHQRASSQGSNLAAPQSNRPESMMTHIMNQGKIIEEMAVHEQYSRVLTPETAPTDEQEDVCANLKQCLDLRDKWLWRDAVSPEMAAYEDVSCVSQIRPDPLHYGEPERSPMDFAWVDGVVHVYTSDKRDELLAAPPGSQYDFFTDMHNILKIINMGPVKTLSHHRLELLEQKFNLHCMLNADKEYLAQKTAPHRDFYNVRKVDTHIHHSACMHQKHLLRFIKSKLKKEPDEVVIFRDGKYLTLTEVFESLNLTAYDLNVDTMDMHADKNIFHRFDKFNLKYNPCGQSRLREIFIKSDNLIHGRFLAELTKEVMEDLEMSKYQHAEWRISIYGRKPVEWDMLANWVCSNKLFSDNVTWLIQLPRLYNIYKDQGIIENFQQMLENIFQPLFECTRDPSKHPQLHIFLSHVVGFDCVDDESKPERRPVKNMRKPADWDLKHNPAFSYYMYYMYANLYTLNMMREARGFNTFKFRPHSGEAGDIDHLVSCFMVAENIAHGINLRKSPALQYLYYVAQIGLMMSPLSNNHIFLDYHRNPFPLFFARGLNVSLSTDDPLQIHLTREPLVEEFSVAAQVWKLSAADLCEIARNSVIQSGFPHPVKLHWVGPYWRVGPDGNDIQKTNVPNLRIRFRTDVYQSELRFIMQACLGYTERMAARASEWMDV